MDERQDAALDIAVKLARAHSRSHSIAIRDCPRLGTPVRYGYGWAEQDEPLNVMRRPQPGDQRRQSRMASSYRANWLNMISLCRSRRYAVSAPMPSISSRAPC
jgi:hypothetical protein